MSVYLNKQGGLSYTNGTADFDHPSQQIARLSQTRQPQPGYNFSGTPSNAAFQPTPFSPTQSSSFAASGVSAALPSGPPRPESWLSRIVKKAICAAVIFYTVDFGVAYFYYKNAIEVHNIPKIPALESFFQMSFGLILRLIH